MELRYDPAYLAGEIIVNNLTYQKKILLVAIHPSNSSQSIPLANSFLRSYVQLTTDVKNIEISSAEYVLQEDITAVAAHILTLNPDYVGFSLYVWNRSYCLKLASLLRLHKPQLTFFAGGPETTADYELLLKTGLFDFLIVGEGEKPFAQICNKLSNNEQVTRLPGVATLDKHGCLNFIKGTPITNLDQIPSPWLTGLIDAGNYSGILWQLSRGCGFTCDFCFDSRGIHGVRRFSLQRIEAELRHFATNNVSQIFVLDSTFNQDLSRAKTILKLIRKIAPQIHFHFEVRSEFIDRELADLFTKITCSLQIGLQSANSQVLKNVGRSFKRDDFVKKVGYLNQSGTTFGFDLIYGLPGETLTSFYNSLDFALELYPNHLDIFSLAILPGTALARRATSSGLIYNQEPPYTVTCTPDMTVADFYNARTVANACDIFYTRGKAVAWFLGVLEPLHLSPSTFLNQFAKWLHDELKRDVNEVELDDITIWQLQRKFATTLFSGKKNRFLPTVLDLIDYHYNYAASVMTAVTVSTSSNTRSNKLFETCFSLAASVRLVKFNHEIMNLLDAGFVDIYSFASHLPRCGSWSIIYPTKNGVATESVGELYFRWLMELDGKTSVRTFCKKEGLGSRDMLEFVEFVAVEGIVVAK